MSTEVVRIGSRGSELALWQSERVKSRLEAAHPGLRVEITILHTTGDRVQDVPLAKIGDKGLFTKELDRAVLDGEVDLAVHSLKDVPTRMEPGLALRIVLPREDPRDVVLTAPGSTVGLHDLPDGARVGTSSLRRRAQLGRVRPDLDVRDLRGNLNTRLRRLADGDYDAIILAHAGVRRLGRTDAISQVLDTPGWLPAAGQGALAAALRDGDDRTARLVQPLVDERARWETTAERAFLRELEGGCQVPIGALARIDGDRIRMHGFVASLDGRTDLRADADDRVEAAESLGLRLARRLIEAGADRVLDQARAEAMQDPPQASAP